MRATALVLALGLAACSGGGGPPDGDDGQTIDTVRTITGRVRYFTTGPRLNTDADGRLIPAVGFVEPTFPRDANRVPVDVLDTTGAVMGSGTTNFDGRYSIQVNFGPDAIATQVRIRIRARLQLPFGTVVQVLSDVTAGEPYTFLSPLGGDPALETMTLPDLVVQRAEGAGAFFILDSLFGPLSTTKAGILSPFPDIDVFYAPGNTDTSTVVAAPDRASITVAGGLPGLPASNQDVWDPPVLARLVGEYLLAYFIYDSAPAGIPTDTPLTPNAAWREGLLDFISCIGRDSTVFWDSTGIGADGKIVRFLNIESFFDPALGSLGPDDPNVYQDPTNTGLTSAMTVAELLWDIHDPEDPGEGAGDGREFPAFVTFRLLERLNPGSHYPYLFTLFDLYTADGSLAPVLLDNLLTFPEDQGLRYPGTDANGFLWPPRFLDGANDGLAVGFDDTLDDAIDTTDPETNLALGDSALRVFQFRNTENANAVVTLTTNLRVEILSLGNSVLAAGDGGATALDLPPDRYVIRVKPLVNPVATPFTVRLQLTAP